MTITDTNAIFTRACGLQAHDTLCRESAARFQAIFEQLADGFFTLDPDWRFTYLNAAARRACGRDDLAGEVIWQAFPDALQTIFETEFRRCMETGASSEFEAFYPPTGIWLRVNAFPFDLGLAVSFADVTEVHRTREQLAAAQAELDDQRQRHDDLRSFAHTVAHDLRAPLTAILGFSQALSDAAMDDLAPRNAHFLRRIRGAAKEMDTLTEAILTLSRIGRDELRRELVDLAPIAADCIQTLRDLEPERRVRVSIAPCIWAECDPGMARVLLSNLLSNAWKYCCPDREGFIEFGTELGDDRELRYFVRDNGVGFEPAQAKAIFRAFHRVHGDTHAGDGIGLATVQRIVERHGGSVCAQSRPGQGTVIHFTLPADNG